MSIINRVPFIINTLNTSKRRRKQFKRYLDEFFYQKLLFSEQIIYINVG